MGRGTASFQFIFQFLIIVLCAFFGGGCSEGSFGGQGTDYVFDVGGGEPSNGGATGGSGDGTVDPSEGAPPPGTLEPSDPPVVTTEPESITVDKTYYSFGEIETGNPEEQAIVLSNPTTSDEAVTVYVDTQSDTSEDGDDPTSTTNDLTLLDPSDSTEISKLSATVSAKGTLSIPFRLKAKTPGRLHATLVIALPRANIGFKIPLSGEIFPKVLRLDSPPRTSYLAAEPSVLFKGSVPKRAFFTKTPSVTLTLAYTDKDNKKIETKTNAPLENGAFRTDLALPPEPGHYEVTVELTDDPGKTFSATRHIYREEAPSFSFRLTNPSGTEIDRKLTDARDMKAVLDLSNPETAGLVWGTLALNGTPLETKTLSARDTESRSLAFDLHGDAVAFSEGTNTLSVSLANRVGTASQQLTFTFDSSAPHITVDSPAATSIVDRLDDVLASGLDLKGKVSGIDLTAIQSAPVTMDPVTGACDPETTPATVSVERTVNGETLTQDVDPCPLRLSVNNPEGLFVHRVRPNPDGSFSFKLSAQSVAADGSVVPGLVFGANSVLLQAKNELGHPTTSLLSFLLGDILPGQWEQDGDLFKAVFPTLEQPFGFSLNNDLLEDQTLHRSIEYSLNDSSKAIKVGNYFKKLTPGMEDCIKAVHTPFYRSTDDGTLGYEDIRKTSIPEACKKGGAKGKGVDGQLTDAMAGVRGASWPTLLLFADDLTAIKAHLNPYSQSMLFRPDFGNTSWVNKHIKKGKIHINSVHANTDGTFSASLSIKELKGNFILTLWTPDKKADSGIGLFPLVWNIKELRLDTTIQLKGGLITVKSKKITWTGDYDTCKTYKGKDIALGCIDEAHASLLFDTSTPYGRKLFLKLKNISENTYEKALKDLEDKRYLDQYAASLTETLLNAFQKSIEDTLSKPVAIKEGLQSINIKDIVNIGIDWDALPVQFSSDGLLLSFLPQLALPTPLSPSSQAGDSFSTLYRKNSEPVSVPFAPERGGIGVLISEQTLNQGLQIISMKGFGSFLNKDMPFEARISLESLLAAGLSKEDVPLSLSSTSLLGTSKDEALELRFYFRDDLPPVFALDSGALTLSMGGLKMSAYSVTSLKENPETVAPLAEFALSLAITFDIDLSTVDAGDIFGISLIKRSTSFIHTAVLENRTGVIYDDSVRTALQGKLNTVLSQSLGEKQCLYIGIPDSFPNSPHLRLCDQAPASAETLPDDYAPEESLIDFLNLEKMLLEQPADLAIDQSFISAYSAIEFIEKGN